MDMELTFRAQVNANRTYFYPVCDASQKLLELMKRKAMVPDDRPRLDALILAMGFTPKIEILPPKTPDF